MFDRPLIDIFMVLFLYFSTIAKNYAQDKVYTTYQSLKNDIWFHLQFYWQKNHGVSPSET